MSATVFPSVIDRPAVTAGVLRPLLGGRVIVRTASALWRGGANGFTGVAGPAMPLGMRPVTGELTGDGRDDLLAYVPGATADRLRPGTANGIG